MLTFKQYLKQRAATPPSDQRRNMLGEQIEMNPADLIDELLAMNAKSIHTQIVTDNDEELTLYLQLKKSRLPREQGGENHEAITDRTDRH